MRKRVIANDEEILARWHAGSSCGSVKVDREAAFAQVGAGLILDVEGWHYEKYHLPGGRHYVVLAWDDHGNEMIE